MSRKKGSTYSQAFRIIRFFEMLQGRNGVTLSEYAREMDISLRTAHRDLQILQECYAVEDIDSRIDGAKAWGLAPKMRGEFIRFSNLEMISILISREMFSFVDGTMLKDSLDQVAHKVGRRLSGRQQTSLEDIDKKVHSTNVAAKSYLGCDDQINEIFTALMREEKVEILYQPQQGTNYKDIIHPYSLVVHNQSLYVIVHSRRASAMRTLAMDRILSASWLRGNRFEFPKNYHPKAFLTEAFGITVGPPVDVELAVHPSIASYFKERTWHSSQQLSVNEHGWVCVKMTVPLTAELNSWILSFGAKMRVIQPARLRDSIAELLRNAVDYYDQGSSYPNQPDDLGEPNESELN